MNEPPSVADALEIIRGLDPGDRYDNAMMNIHDAAETLQEIGEARKDRVILYLAEQLLSYHQEAEEAREEIQARQSERNAAGSPA
jgi:hypothetical protein